MDHEIPVSTWAQLCRVHGSVARSLESELMADFGLSLASLTVLRTLSETDQQRARLNCLVASSELTKSGLSRMIDRLESSGLVSTEGCPSDGRGSFAVLTPRGVEVVQAASQRFCGRVHDVLAGSLSQDEITALGDILARVAP